MNQSSVSMTFATDPFAVFPIFEHSRSGPLDAPISCEAKVGSVQVDVFVDSGAAVCIMGEETVKLQKKTLEPYKGLPFEWPEHPYNQAKRSPQKFFSLGVYRP